MDRKNRSVPDRKGSVHFWKRFSGLRDVRRRSVTPSARCPTQNAIIRTSAVEFDGFQLAKTAGLLIIGTRAVGRADSCRRVVAMPHTEKPSAFLGYWKITHMETWAQHHVDLVVPGFIEFTYEDDLLMGRFQFGTVSGWLDCRPRDLRRDVHRVVVARAQRHGPRLRSGMGAIGRR
jgi:hypothetical protein